MRCAQGNWLLFALNTALTFALINPAPSWNPDLSVSKNLTKRRIGGVTLFALGTQSDYAKPNTDTVPFCYCASVLSFTRGPTNSGFSRTVASSTNTRVFSFKIRTALAKIFFPGSFINCRKHLRIKRHCT